ncbi:MAG TPA: VWA domain-containing protein [Candidatus Acidoferrum sp.]|jgi:VWFA-related protein|nr:VWA domain-containing protein [Candidatus Acidoferrum sp.]
MRRSVSVLWMLFVSALLGAPLAAQSPEGPIAPVPGVQVQQAPPQAKLVVRVSLVNTPVTVRDAKGEMVDNLEVKDFRITDNGVEQKISHFDLGGDPISLAVLLETSSRIDPLLPELRKTGILMTQTVMGPTGEAAIVGFNDSVDKLQDFTTNADQIERTVSRLQTSTSGSKLYDAMAVAVEMLSGRPQATPERPSHRRVMLILSEATDIGSETRLGEVLRQAQLSNVTIYSVGLSTTRAELQAKPKDPVPQVTPPGTFGLPPQPGVPQTPDTEAARYGSGNLLALAVWAVQHVKDKISDHALEVAATATGGAHLATFKDRSIEKAIDEIGGELHSQYSLSYTPAGTNEVGYHEIKVLVTPGDLKVRARPGYYVAQPES